MSVIWNRHIPYSTVSIKHGSKLVFINEKISKFHQIINSNVTPVTVSVALNIWITVHMLKANTVQWESLQYS